MTIKKLLQLACVAALTTCGSPVPILFAQSAEIPPVPAPSPGESVVERGPLAQIAMDNGTGVTLRLLGKHARRILLQAGHRATITLRYDPSYAGSNLEVAALDAGKASFAGGRNVVAPNGMAVLQFSGADRPGLYRLVINCGGTASTLQFWVPDPGDPGDPGNDASVLSP